MKILKLLNTNMTTFTTQITLFSNRFDVTVNADLITNLKNLNIGNLVKKRVTSEIQKLIGKGVNVSYFKRYQDIINQKLEESNLRVEEYITQKKVQKLFLTIQYVGLTEKRDKKIEKLLNA